MLSLLAVVGKLSCLSYMCMIYVQVISGLCCGSMLMWILVVGNDTVDMGSIAILLESLPFSILLGK